jgi:hypothetical protein
MCALAIADRFMARRLAAHRAAGVAWATALHSHHLIIRATQFGPVFRF